MGLPESYLELPGVRQAMIDGHGRRVHKAPKKQPDRIKLTAELMQQMQLAGLDLDEWRAELEFHPTRKWRFDLAHEFTRTAVEVDGLTRGGGGRHQRPEGFAEDCRKLNQAQLHGWRVIRVTRPQVRDLTGVRDICAALGVECGL